MLRLVVRGRPFAHGTRGVPTWQATTAPARTTRSPAGDAEGDRDGPRRWEKSDADNVEELRGGGFRLLAAGPLLAQDKPAPPTPEVVASRDAAPAAWRLSSASASWHRQIKSEEVTQEGQITSTLKNYYLPGPGADAREARGCRRARSSRPTTAAGVGPSLRPG